MTIKIDFSRLISTLFYLGYFPVAPGTVGSLVALGFYYLVWQSIPLLVALILLLLLISVGILMSGRVSASTNLRDPGYIIIDEFAGMLLAFSGFPFHSGLMITGFLLFRFFDILKPLGIKRVEQLSGGWGIMLDDLLAGVYTWIILFVIKGVML